MPEAVLSTTETVKMPKEKKEKKSKKIVNVIENSESVTVKGDDVIEKKTEKKEKSKKRKASIEADKGVEETVIATETVEEMTIENATGTEETAAEMRKKEKKEKKEKRVKKQKVDESSDSPVKSTNTMVSSTEKPSPTVIKISEDVSQEQAQELSIDRFGLAETTKAALLKRGIAQLFPIQAASFQHIVDGKDLVGRARTGTGKTLAFALPMVEMLKRESIANPSMFSRRGRPPKVLVMAPTRELASQVAKEFETIADHLKVICIYGGVAYDQQCQAFRDGVDIVVGTPGRLIDHVEKGYMKLDQLMYVCMDEADQMLDIGFADNMDMILKCVKDQKAAKRSASQTCPETQTLLFSATMPEWIKEAIRKYMKADKITVDLIGSGRLKTSESVKHYAIPSHWQSRTQILGDILTVYGRGKAGRTIIFVETKGEANELVLNEKLKDSQVIHGDIVQKQRESAMQGFRDGKFRCLIATNVCARGVDIPEVDLVINCEPPGDVETYIHRSGRTGRAGKSGICVTFYKPQQEYMINLITKRAGTQFTRIGAPQPSDIISAYASETVDKLPNVHPEAMRYFSATADQVLDHFGGNAKKAVEACLAMICDTTQPLAPRSLLSATEGYLTLLFKSDQPIRNPGFIRAILQRKCPQLGYDDTRGWRMTADDMGVVVDMDAKKIKIIQNDDAEHPTIRMCNATWSDERGVTLEIAKEVPELKEMAVQNNGARGGNGGGYGGRSGNGGYGARAGGRGGSRGGNQRFGNRR